MTVDLDTGINIFSGQGGTGKSSLIEALGLIFYWNLYELKTNTFSHIRRVNTDTTIIQAEISVVFLHEDFKDTWQAQISPELLNIIATTSHTGHTTIKLIIHINNTFDYYLNDVQLTYTHYYEWYRLITGTQPAINETKTSQPFVIENFFATELDPEEAYKVFVDQLGLTEAVTTYNDLDKQVKRISAEKESFQTKIQENLQIESNLTSQIKILEEYNNLKQQLELIEQELLYAPLAALENRHTALKNSLQRIVEDITRTKQLLAEKESQQTKLNDDILNLEKEKNSKTQEYETFRQQYLEKRALQDRSSRKTAEIEKSLTSIQFKLRQANMKVSDINRRLQELEKNKAVLAEKEYNEKRQLLVEQQRILNKELESLNEQYNVYKQEQKLKLIDLQSKDKKSTLLSDEIQKQQHIVEEITANYEKMLEQHDMLHTEIEILAEKIDAFEEEKEENEKELATLTKNLSKESAKTERKKVPRPPAIRAPSTLNNLKNNIESKIAQLEDKGIQYDAYKQLQAFQDWKKKLVSEDQTREQDYLLINQKLVSWKQSWNKTLEHQKEQFQQILNFLLAPFGTKVHLHLSFAESPDKGMMKNSLLTNDQTCNPKYLSSSEQAMLEYLLALTYTILTGKQLFIDDKLLQRTHIANINALLSVIQRKNTENKDIQVHFPQIIFTYPRIPVPRIIMAEHFSKINIIAMIRQDTSI